MHCICVLVSLKFEADYLLDCLGGIKKRIVSGFTVYDGVLGEVPVRIIKTGMGKAHIDTSLFSSCSIVVSTGVCGALNGELRTGDVVVAEEIVFIPEEQIEDLVGGTVQDYSLYRTTLLRIKNSRLDLDALIKVISEHETGKPGLRVLRGRIITVPRVIGKVEEKRKLGSYFQAIACDMEDFFRAAPLIEAGIPFVSARVVIDELSDEVPPSIGAFAYRPFKAFYLLKKLPLAKRAVAFLVEKIASFSSLFIFDSP